MVKSCGLFSFCIHKDRTTLSAPDEDEDGEIGDDGECARHDEIADQDATRQVIDVIEKSDVETHNRHAAKERRPDGNAERIERDLHEWIPHHEGGQERGFMECRHEDK